jgi:hypothetical protein
MSIGLILFVIAIVLMALAAFGITSRVNLWYLGWAFALAGYIAG